ncbi:MAG: antibiotic biosynthesis monooxygenase [Bacteroidetes bacterium]|nr:MAG: antibiotic biosynthesis monooxygenase [Bacteroidota bacterium]PTM09636.1 MAG: antibiotic biosynthesis monooxygenase [Bacteroidota bacterium]
MAPLKRLVKMTFRPEEVSAFEAIFAASSPHIRAFAGCQHLELWRSQEFDNILFTFSIWESAAALEGYRQSDLFRATWAQTKALFADQPAAWSVDVLAEL